MLNWNYLNYLTFHKYEYIRPQMLIKDLILIRLIYTRVSSGFARENVKIFWKQNNTVFFCYFQYGNLSFILKLIKYSIMKEIVRRNLWIHIFNITFKWWSATAYPILGSKFFIGNSDLHSNLWVKMKSMSTLNWVPYFTR